MLDVGRLTGRPGELEPFRDTDADEREAAFAPNGRWIAYQSNESGRFEIWLQSYPDPTRARHLITTEGGEGPLWGPGGELFYHNAGSMMAVQIDLATGLPGTPSQIFEGDYEFGAGYRNYDVTADGQRFLMVKPRGGTEKREVVVVLNWLEELKRLMGGN